MNKYRGVEQMVARRAHNPKVIGSSPIPATNKREIIFPFFYLGYMELSGEARNPPTPFFKGGDSAALSF